MLPRWLETLLDDGARGRLAARIDRPIDIAFTIVRNAGFVAVAQYVAERGAHPGFRLVYIALALLLMVQIASRFMLQPQIRLFRSPMSDRRRLVQGAANMALCAAACALAIYAIDLFVRGMIAFQIGTP
ncbi:MAG: hypothetical protein GVX90_03395 [Alphaproteobacteria bacterium]|jgi:hypothetical protein|nr:hypothetical protein [Alphaproteobacteria bacterium]